MITNHGKILSKPTPYQGLSPGWQSTRCPRVSTKTPSFSRIVLWITHPSDPSVKICWPFLNVWPANMKSWSVIMFELWNVVEPQNPVTCTPQAGLSFRLPKQIWFFEMMPHYWGVRFCQGFTMFHRYLRFDGTSIFRSRMASVSFFPWWIRAKVPMWMGSSSGVSWGACKMPEMWPGSFGINVRF